MNTEIEIPEHSLGMALADFVGLTANRREDRRSNVNPPSTTDRKALKVQNTATSLNGKAKLLAETAILPAPAVGRAEQATIAKPHEPLRKRPRELDAHSLLHQGGQHLRRS
jgi:hypothetical protein